MERFTRFFRSMVKLGRPLAWINWSSVILSRLDLEPGMTLLDAGCGTGRLSVPAAKRVGDTGKVVAVDLQERVLRRAMKKTRRARLANVNFIRSGITDSDLESDHFDRALLIAVLGDTLERTAALKAIFRALKPGGLLAVTEHIFDPHFQDRNTVARLAEISGFRIKAFHGTPIAYTLDLQKPRTETRTTAAEPSPVRTAVASPARTAVVPQRERLSA